jgi:putative addiction module component (TIGR02574 family)
MSSDDLLRAALELPPPERAKLARELLESLDESSEPGVEQAWLAEVTRRAQELADGTVEPVDWSVARERISRRLRERRR